MQISQNYNLIKVIGVTVFTCATWSLLAGSINLANDTSPSIAEKIINIPAAAAISLGGGIMFYYSRKTHFLESILIMAFGLVLFAAEVNTQFGSYAVSDTSYKSTSAAQQQENKTIALQEKELNDWDKVSINRSALIAERATLEGELSAKKESSAINCKSSWKTCKAKQLAGSGEIEAKISAVNSQLDLADKKDSALSSAKYTFSTIGKDDYKKQHPHFISTAEFLYDTPKEAERARILLRFIQSFAVVLLSYIGLRMAYYNETPNDDKTETEENGDNVINKFKRILKQANEKTSALNAVTKSNIVAKKTGTDNGDYKPVTMPEQRGTATVLHFPVTVTAAKKSESLKRNGNDKKPHTRQRVDRNIITELKAKCAYCNDEFVTTNLKKRFCSDAHRVASHREKNPSALKHLKKDSIK